MKTEISEYKGKIHLTFFPENELERIALEQMSYLKSPIKENHLYEIQGFGVHRYLGFVCEYKEQPNERS